MPKSWFTVQANADGQRAKVDVRGYIGEWGVTDRDFGSSPRGRGTRTPLAP